MRSALATAGYPCYDNRTGTMKNRRRMEEQGMEKLLYDVRVYSPYQQGATSFTYLFLFLLGLWILLYVVSWCRLFSRADLPWERVFVPVYGNYWRYKIAGSPGVFCTTVLLPVGLGAVSAFTGYGIFERRVVYRYLNGYYMAGEQLRAADQVMDAVWLAALALILVLNCLYLYRLAKCFGKSGWFAAGLILLYPVFILILGLGKAEYVGTEALISRKEQERLSTPWVCPGCGSENPNARATCRTCGSLRP